MAASDICHPKLELQVFDLVTPVTQTSSSSSSPHLVPVADIDMDAREVESGYTSETLSASSSTASLPQVALTKPHLDFLNAQLENLSPLEILRFTRILFPNLYQTTAFGLTGLVTLDMLAKLQAENPSSSPVDLIFLDTLHHFDETHDLIRRIKERYPGATLHIFKPFGADTVEEFDAMYGEKLYEADPEMYDWAAKVEPQQRAYADLSVAAVLTGRRRSQGAARGKLPILELDEERGVVKINPMANWSFAEVQAYIKENDVPYNALLDQGYKSVGDWHSTSPVSDGEDERAGRWKGQAKTECGIHNKQSRYAEYLREMELKGKGEKLAAGLGVAVA